MSTSVFPTGFGLSGFADSATAPAVGSANKDSALQGHYPQGQITPHAFAVLRAVLIASVVFWLIVAWAVWSVW
jgi:hypothetical protein